MLITSTITIEPHDYIALHRAIKHYKQATPDHTPDKRTVRILDDILRRINDSETVESRYHPARREAPDPAD